MSRPSRQPFLAVLLVLAGCGTDPAISIRLGSMAATYGGLYAGKASEVTAAKVKEIAVSVQLSTSGGELDWDVLQASVIAQIKANFPEAQQGFVLQLASDIASIVMSLIPPSSGPAKVLIYANAAATGAVQGCTLYIASIQPRPVGRAVDAFIVRRATWTRLDRRVDELLAGAR